MHLQRTPCGAEAPNHLDIKLNNSGVKAAPEPRPHVPKAEVIFQAFYTFESWIRLVFQVQL